MLDAIAVHHVGSLLVGGECEVVSRKLLGLLN